MSYIENHKKFVAVANKKATVVEIMNGLAHCFIGLAGSSTPEAVTAMELLDYRFVDDSLVARLSTYPVVILQARNTSQLERLRQESLAAGVQCSSFVRTMLGTSAEGQIADTAALNSEAHDFIVVCLWGEAAVLDPMLKRFSCFKCETPQEVHVS